MKADKELTVDRNAVRAIPQLIKMLVPPRETAEGFWSPDIDGAIRLLQSIQRAAFEKGAKAQREADKIECPTCDGHGFMVDENGSEQGGCPSCRGSGVYAVAPPVEFEEEVRCGEDGPAGGTREGAPGEES